MQLSDFTHLGNLCTCLVVRSSQCLFDLKQPSTLILVNSVGTLAVKLLYNSPWTFIKCSELCLGLKVQNVCPVIPENIDTSPKEGFFGLNPATPLEILLKLHTFL